MMWGAGGWWVIMALWMVVFWGAVIAGVVWLVRSAGHRSVGASADDLLKRRLASGEIDAEQYRMLKQELGTASPWRTARASISASVILATIVAVSVLIPVAAAATGGWGIWDHMRSMHGEGENTSDSALVRSGGSVDVSIRDFAFFPGNLEVPVGATVTWRNSDSVPHDATPRSGEWRTERLSQGETDSLAFDAPGDYDYYCSIHPSMKARLRVR